MTKHVRNLIVLVVTLVLGSPLFSYAVSYSTVPEQREEKIASGSREKGETVCLFQSGTADVRKEIHIGDVLVVYREAAPKSLVQVGTIKVLSFAGEDYLKGVVVSGEVRTGDLAKKGDAAGLVISFEDRCK